MFDKVQFEITEKHIKLMKNMNVGYNEHCEFGAPDIDPKRPYGNGNVYRDIARILEIEPALIKDGESIFSEDQEDAMLALHKQMKTALQVVLTASTFETGLYESDEYHDNWQKIKG